MINDYYSNLVKNWLKRTDTVKINSVHIGTWVESICGTKLKVVKKHDNGIVDVIDEDGEEHYFEASATVAPIITQNSVSSDRPTRV